ncbi:MAG: hypothetical protein R3B91_04645 [Planctomycetaceae bacterium]
MTGKRLWSTPLTDEPPSHSYPEHAALPRSTGIGFMSLTSNEAHGACSGTMAV